MSDWIIKTTECRSFGAHAAERWQFIRDERGVRAQAWFDINRLTSQEQAAYEKAMEEYPDAEAEGYPPEELPRWPTVMLAERWAALIDEERSLGEELGAYNAPGECGTRAYAELEKRRRELLKYAVKETSNEQT